MAKALLPIVLGVGAFGAFALLRGKSEASEGDDGGDNGWYTPGDGGTGGDDAPVGSGWRPIGPRGLPLTIIDPGLLVGVDLLGTAAGGTSAQDAARNAYLAQLEDRAQGLGLTLDDVETVVDHILAEGHRVSPNAMYRVIFSMESLDELIPLLSNIALPITPPPNAVFPVPGEGPETRELQEALNGLETRMIEASMLQEGLWFGANAFRHLHAAELSSQFGSSVFATYVHQIQQIGAMGLRSDPVKYPFLSAQEGQVCGVRGELLSGAGISWRAESGVIRLSAPCCTMGNFEVPVSPLGWARTVLHTRPMAPGEEQPFWGDLENYNGNVSDRSWPLVEDGHYGPCTQYAQTVVFAAAAAVGLADVAAGLTGLNPSTGRPNPSVFNPAQVVRNIDRDLVVAGHLALGWRSLKEAGLIQWRLRYPDWVP